MNDVNAFIAGDWKVTSDLTLNLGVRWEYFGFPSEKNGLLAVFDLQHHEYAVVPEPAGRYELGELRPHHAYPRRTAGHSARAEVQVLTAIRDARGRNVRKFRLAGASD